MTRFFMAVLTVGLLASSAQAADVASVSVDFSANATQLVIYNGNTAQATNGEAPKQQNASGFRWGAWSALATSNTAAQIGHGYPTKPISGDTNTIVGSFTFRPAAAVAGSYNYTIFDSTGAQPPATPDVVKNLTSVNVTTQMLSWSTATPPVADPSTQIDVALLLRDGAGGWWKSVQTTTMTNEVDIAHSYDFTVGTMTWEKVNQTAADDMNLMDDDIADFGGPGLLTPTTAGTIDLTSITGCGAYLAGDKLNGTTGAFRIKSISLTGSLAPTPGVAVTVNANPVADGATTPVALGSYEVAETAADVVFTVTNSGTLPLTVSGITVPAGVIIVEDLTAGDIAPAGSDTFTVKLDTVAEATISGEISFTTNVTAANPFNFAVSGQVGPVTAVREWEQY